MQQITASIYERGFAEIYGSWWSSNMPVQPERIRELCALALHAPDDATLLRTVQELRAAITEHTQAFRSQAANDIQRFSINESDLYLFLEDSTATAERSDTEQE